MVAEFTDLIRRLSDEALAALLRARPDLAQPLPADLTALAARAQSRTSVTRMLDQLTEFELAVLDGIRVTRDPAGVSSLDQLLTVTVAAQPTVTADRVRDALRRLTGTLLVYGPEDALRVVPTVDEVLGPYPAGLGRPAAELSPAAAELVADSARLRRTVLSAPPPARAVLERLAAGPPVGTVAAAPGTSDRADPAGGGADADGGDPAGPVGQNPSGGPPEDAPDLAERTGADPAGGDGESSGGATDPTDPDVNPVAWLVDRALLVATSPTTVELPREVGLLLRRETGPLPALRPAPPVPTTGTVDPGAVDSAGAGQAMTAVQRTAGLLAALAEDPPPVLRSGGLGVRELRRLARTVDLTEATTALLLETGQAAGLIGQAEPARGTTGEATFQPTTGYDSWRAAPLPAQWQTVATAWLTMPRQPGLVGGRDGRDRVVSALSGEVTQAAAAVTRLRVLEVLAELPEGVAPSHDQALALVAWHLPRWLVGREAACRQVLDEAAALGVTGRGALTSYGAALLDQVRTPAEPAEDPLGIRADDDGAARPVRAAERLAELVPAPVDEVLVQADLTVVVPGPPEPTLAAELELLAEPESAGGGGVYRLTRESVRRALDAGHPAEELHGIIARRSRTPVPQALTYLIDDVARAHGGLRAGSATAYLRSDDTALVAQLLADRRLAPLRLRPLAPTVLASVASRERLVAALREAGYSPVAEDAGGAPVLARAQPRRAPKRPGPPAPVDPTGAARMSTPRLLGIVEDLRRGEATRAARGPATVRYNGRPAAGGGNQSHTEALAVLQQAVRDRAQVWVGYVDAHGARNARLLRPVSIGAGYLRAEDERTDTLHTFALHRITGAAWETTES